MIRPSNYNTTSMALDDVGLAAFTPSTLLIPEHRLVFFLMRKKQFNGIGNYFLYLLSVYASKLIKSGIFPSQTSKKWKKQYQKQGLELKRADFLPNPCAWEAYRQISNQYGLSICHLFVIAMRLDYYDWLMADCPEEIPFLAIMREFRKTTKKLPTMPMNFNYSSFSYQKIDFTTKILSRSGRSRHK